MTKINLGERNELAVYIQSMKYKEELAEKKEKVTTEKTALKSNELAKRAMASELMLQGFKDEAICRILNISTKTIAGVDSVTIR